MCYTSRCFNYAFKFRYNLCIIGKYIYNYLVKRYLLSIDLDDPKTNMFVGKTTISLQNVSNFYEINNSTLTKRYIRFDAIRRSFSETSVKFHVMLI